MRTGKLLNGFTGQVVTRVPALGATCRQAILHCVEVNALHLPGLTLLEKVTKEGYLVVAYFSAEGIADEKRNKFLLPDQCFQIPGIQDNGSELYPAQEEFVE